MKCSKCPLYKVEYSYGCDDSDEICLADWRCHELPSGVYSETGGCHRTNKWILSQNPEKLEDKYLDYENKCWAEYEKLLLERGKNNAN